MGAALAHPSFVEPSLSVAVPLVLPALPPALVVVVAPVTAGSPGWCGKHSGRQRVIQRNEEADDLLQW